MLGGLVGDIVRASLRCLPGGFRDRLLGVVLETASDRAKLRLGIPTVGGVLAHLAGNGFSPAAIIDVGAYVGEWGRTAAHAFPSAELYMIDGNPENASTLRDVERSIGKRAHCETALLGPEAKEQVRFFRMASGSSVLEELTTIDRTTVELPMTTLDELFSNRELIAPILLKLDVQGFELEVLRGGSEVLAQAEVVVLETSLLPYNQGAPLFGEVHQFMEDAGFVLFDFCGQFRRQTDQVLFQTDVVFARAESALRAPRRFWLNER